MSVRVAALLVRDGQVLLARHEKGGESYWVLPGGEVEPGEALAEALQRELREEAGIEAELGDLLFVNDGYRPEAETVALYFAASVRDELPSAKLPGEKVLREVRWFAAGELADLNLRPDVKEELLEYLTTGTVHCRYLGRR